MAEYIEREEVREAFYMEFDEDYADDIVDRIPTADVQEVRHGKWIPSVFGTIICSECKERFSLFGSVTEKFYYCPNCGAKMDKE